MPVFVTQEQRNYAGELVRQLDGQFSKECRSGIARYLTSSGMPVRTFTRKCERYLAGTCDA